MLEYVFLIPLIPVLLLLGIAVGGACLLMWRMWMGWCFFPSIYEAAAKGSVRNVKHFVEVKRVDVNAKTKQNWTPLHNAILHSNVKVVEYLITHGAYVNATGAYGMTPLHFAADSFNVDIVKFLIERGADVNAKCNEGDTPLHYAAYIYSLDVVKCLVDLGADVNAKNNDGETPLHSAVKNLYVDYGNCDPNDPSGEFHDANRANGDVLKYLIDEGADVHAKNNEGKTAFDVADTDEKKNFLKECVSLALSGRQ